MFLKTANRNFSGHFESSERYETREFRTERQATVTPMIEGFSENYRNEFLPNFRDSYRDHFKVTPNHMGFWGREVKYSIAYGLPLYPLNSSLSKVVVVLLL